MRYYIKETVLVGLMLVTFSIITYPLLVFVLLTEAGK